MAYTLRYLPLAQEDLIEIADYIQNTLQNPIAAENTITKIESAILERLESPESFAVWQSSKHREHPYRRINVGNILSGTWSLMMSWKSGESCIRVGMKKDSCESYPSLN